MTNSSVLVGNESNRKATLNWKSCIPFRCMYYASKERPAVVKSRDLE